MKETCNDVQSNKKHTLIHSAFTHKNLKNVLPCTVGLIEMFFFKFVSPSGTSYPDSFSYRIVQIAITAYSWADKLPHCINQSVYSLRAVIDAMSKINHLMLYNIDSKIFYKLVNCINIQRKISAWHSNQ